MTDIYTSGKYLKDNPGWHIGDSAWKSKQVLRMVAKHNLRPASVCEVGCGAGEILSQLCDDMPGTTFTGYEVSPQAFELCRERKRDRLNFVLGDLLETRERFDLLLCIDVFEHIPNYLSFIERLHQHADWFIFHIPLDLSLLTILRPKRLLKTRYGVGHLHMFTYELAKSVLKDTGYEILDSYFTAGGLELSKNKRNMRTVLANLPRRVFSLFSERFAVQILGGYSLMVLTKTGSSLVE